MIGVSWMPARAARKRKCGSAYSPRRTARRVGRARGSDDSAPRLYSLRTAIFGRRAALPAARLRGAESGNYVAAILRGWAAGASAWLRPRAIPMLVAALGSIAILGSTAWLRRLATETPQHVTAPGASTVHPRMVIDMDGHHRVYKVVATPGGSGSPSR